MRGKVVAIDGPAGSGKSTVAKLLARRLGFTYIDTGAMYRAVTVEVLNQGVDPNDNEKIKEILKDIIIELGENGKVKINNKDVTDKIRDPSISNALSIISANPLVRNRLVEIQREMAIDKDIVMEGRDIGTVVFPDAEYKFFLTADIRERALRRMKELREVKNVDISLEEVMKEIESRDIKDQTRKDAPLRKAEDAILIDTTDMSIEEVVSLLESKIKC